MAYEPFPFTGAAAHVEPNLQSGLPATGPRKPESPQSAGESARERERESRERKMTLRAKGTLIVDKGRFPFLAWEKNLISQGGGKSGLTNYCAFGPQGIDRYRESGKKKAHEHKRFGPVGLGMTPGLSQGQTGLSLGQALRIFSA